MKHLLSILLISTLFAGELEVDGNLKVTGTVESTTIDSLKAVIAELQAQLAALQGAGVLQTRVYELPRFYFNGVTEIELDLSQITGFDLDYAILDIVYVSDFATEATVSSIRLGTIWGNGSFAGIEVHLWSNGAVNYITTYENITYTGGELFLEHSDGGSLNNGYADIIISVTAQFPN